MQVQEQTDRLATIRAAFPKEGLFAEKEWLLSPDAFPIDRKSLADLEQLGHRLFVFQRACNQLYQLSVKGKQPEWVARYLDAGKPKELIEFSRRKEIRDDLPRVIRPDLILTEKGYIIAEIDSVPGGIGLTGWLNQTYSSFDNDIIGGANGMLEGFRAVVPNGADIVISQESATYRPEMEWLAARLNQTSDLKPQASPWRVMPAENYEPHDGRAVYRFFELFDLPNIPEIENALRANRRRANYDYAADQALSRRKNVVRALLASAAARILATRTGRQILHQVTGSDPLLLAARSNSPASTRSHSTTGNSRLARGCEVQSERSRSSFESERFFPAWLGQPRHRARERPAARRLGKANRTRVGDIRIVANDPAALSQGPLV